MEEKMDSMREVWVADGSVFSPLGNSCTQTYERMLQGSTGIALVDNRALSPTPVHVSAISDLPLVEGHSTFESMCLEALKPILDEHDLPDDRTILILSTTKGNISLLTAEGPGGSRLPLHETTSFLASRAGFKKHFTVSNACISGVMALAAAMRLLQAGKYDHAVVLGADLLSKFVVSGFQSLHALSDSLCRPFDLNRKGINLGEAAAALLVTARPEKLKVKANVKILGAAFSNDANHISGPSRTGEELSQAIGKAMKESGVRPSEVDFISAHGTATVFNDEMEARAFHLAGLGAIPVHSLKGYFGHTLGAAGVLEVALGIESLNHGTLIPTFGFEEMGVSIPLNVVVRPESKHLKTFLKTASGFGGCNAAMVLQKVNEL
jgi:3-oxoacyl-[acyl-carrier-protein] synthase-1